MKSIICVMLILLCTWSAFGQEAAPAQSPAAPYRSELLPESQTTPASASDPGKTANPNKKSHKVLWITVGVAAVVVVAVVVGSLVATRLGNE